MLKLKAVYFSYENTFGLENISLHLKKGETLGVIGASGCGKTTLLKLIFGEIQPAQGELFWNGDKILGPTEQLINGHEDFKYVTQDFELMPFISVLDNIIKPLSRQYMQENKTRAKLLLEVVGLEDVENQKVKTLSGGQKQRVALAKALAKTPQLLLLDEPFSHIDNFFKNKLRRRLFKFLKQEKITVVLATHDKADVLPFSDKILVLKNGQPQVINTPQHLFKKPGNTYVAGLFGDYNHISSKLIWKDIDDDRKVIVYPQDIMIFESELPEVKIIEHYFMGAFYKIIIEWKAQELIVHHPLKLDITKQYKIGFDKSAIKQRNSIDE
jgi:ABC-type sulfate/molybdate transport systems ATPase subunit